MILPDDRLRELRAAEARFLGLLEAAPDAIIVTDRNRLVTLVNSQMERLFGYARDELIGRSHEILLPERFRQAHLGHTSRYMDSPTTRPMGTGLDLFARRKDGSEFPVEISLSPFDPGDGLLVITIIRDISERKRQEEALRLSEQRFHAIFDQSFEFIGLLSPEGLLLEANQTALDFIQAPLSTVVGRPFWETPWWTGDLQAQDRLRGAVQEAAQGQLVRFEVDHFGAEGKVVPVDFSLKPVRDGQGAVIQLIPEGRDVSERKAAEDLRETLTAAVTHDLRNPLAVIHAYATILQSTGAFNERAVSGILNQTAHLNRMVGDLLDVSHLDSGQFRLAPAPVDLVALAQSELEKAQATSDRHALRLTAPAELVGVWDGDRLRQVLQNLLSNAIKYSPEGGAITVAIQSQAGETQVTIVDEGVGIAADALPHLFERFYRTASARRSGQKGLGLGLHIARALVEAHGGRVWAESAGEGKGSTFSICLPLQAPG